MKKYSTYLLALAKKHVIKRKQFILYAIIGLSGVTIDFLFYTFSVGFLGMGVLLANFISISLGIINNFILNTRFNFKVRDKMLLRFGLFYGVGFLGLIFSEVLLAIFHYGLDFGPTASKLLTLLPVLLGQYALNKYVSFGSLEDVRRTVTKRSFHWPAIVLLILFLMCSLMFVKFIPADYSKKNLGFAPDEIAHYVFNVEFIMKNHRLPVSGKDDLVAYENCRDNPSALVPCLYSYSFYPGPSYVVSAASAGIISNVFPVTPQLAARVPSTFYGGIFLVTVYASAYLLSKRRKIATLITFGLAFIPQYIFVSSYTNLDAHSVAISGLVGLALVKLWLSPHSKWTIPFMGVAVGGLLPLAKYNYFVLVLPVFATLIWYIYKKLLTRREVLRAIVWGFGSFIVLAAFWYIRNTVLYHDPLGQNFALEKMTEYHALGTAHQFNIITLNLMSNMNFFSILYNSFYLAYGGMFYFLEPYKYVVPQIATAIAAFFVVYVWAEDRYPKRVLVASLAYLGFFLLTLGQVYFNSIHYDFQPQGRYMFPMLIATALYFAYMYRVNHRFEALSVLLAISTLYLFVSGAEVFMKVYLNV